MKISKELMTLLKNLAKSQGVTQKMIAEKFEVSLPTVKRWYQGKGLTLEQANLLSEYLGISLGEALMSIKKNTNNFEYTMEQENFFSNNPDYLAFFDNLIRGKTVQSVVKKFNISNIKTTKYLLKMEKLGLIELLPKNKVKLLVTGEPVWRKNGPLSKRFKNKIINDFLESFNSVKFNKFHLFDLNTNDVEKLIISINEIMDFATNASNRAAISSGKSKSYGFSVSLKGFTWSLDSFL